MSASTLAAAVSALQGKFAGLEKSEFRGETTLLVPAAVFRELAVYCRELGFSYLVDVSGVDHFGAEPRFELVYELYHFDAGYYLRVKYFVSEDELQAPTVSDLWPTADWHEREVFDMMGIRFIGHPDLRRILMWDGYPYFPLRKDFPLAGRPSEMPDVAFTAAAPLAGGPFVTLPSTATTKDREPRSRSFE